MHVATAVKTLPFVLFLSLTACATEEPEPQVQTPPTTEMAATTDVEAIRSQVEQVRNDWIAAAERDDAAAVAAMYAEDALLIESDGTVTEGRSGIQGVWTEAFPTASQLQVTSMDFDASGDLAYDVGEYTQQITPANAQPFTATGKYLVVLERQADGNWQIVKHISAAPTPPAEMTAGGM